MISFKFDVSDLSEFDKQFYMGIDINVPDNPDIDDLLTLFKTFLYGLGYQPETINEYIPEVE